MNGSIRIDARREFLEKYFEATKDPKAAEELAAIYLGGLCNSSIPEVNKAAKYIHYVYTAEMGCFCEGEMDGRFMHAAFRLGIMYERGLGFPVDRKRAYECFLQAECALRLREAVLDMQESEEFRTELYKALERCRDLFENEQDVPYPELVFLEKLLTTGALVEMSFERRRSEQPGTEMIHIRCGYHVFAADGTRRRVLITLPSVGYCEQREFLEFHLLCEKNTAVLPKEREFVPVKALIRDRNGWIHFLSGGEHAASMQIKEN